MAVQMLLNAALAEGYRPPVVAVSLVHVVVQELVLALPQLSLPELVEKC